MIGQLLDGRYQVIRVLGSGGFGQTYIAQDTRRPGSPVCVVKHLKPASNDSNLLKLAQRLFKSEAEVLEQLGSHSQIPQLLAYFEERQEFYLVQEFIRGNRLTEELPAGGRWTESQVIELLHGILGILSFLHSKGAIHRDIKPDNIIRRQSDNKFVLVDFGAVKQVRTPMAIMQGPVTETIGLGTPGYMPSEQGQGKPRPSSDIYALGVIGIQAATGLRPYQLDDDPETGEIIWQPHAQLSPELTAILSKMVKCYFKERYTSAIEVLQALQEMEPYPTATQSGNFSRYTPTRPVPTEFVPPTQPATSSAFAPTQLATSNEQRSPNPFFMSDQKASDQKVVEQTQPIWRSIPHDQLARPIPTLYDQFPRPTLVTNNQLSKPTKLQSGRTVFLRVVTVLGWGFVTLAIGTEVFFVGRQINPHFFNRLLMLPEEDIKPSPPPQKSSSTAKPSSTSSSSSTTHLPPLNNPFPLSKSHIDILSPDTSPTLSPSPVVNRPSPRPSLPTDNSSPAASTESDGGSATLDQAQQEANGGHLLDAIATAQTIASDSSVYDESQQAIAKWQGQLSKATCPSNYAIGTSSSNSGEQTGRLAFTNNGNESVSVNLYSPDAPKQPFGTWRVDPGQQLILGQQTYSANWGIQVNCSRIHPLSEVSDLASAGGSNIFETSADRVP